MMHSTMEVTTDAVVLVPASSAPPRTRRGAHGGDLRGDDHGAGLRGGGRGAAPGDGDGGGEGAHLAGHGDADQVRDVDGGAELAVLAGAVQRQHGADEEGEEGHDGD